MSAGWKGFLQYGKSNASSVLSLTLNKINKHGSHATEQKCLVNVCYSNSGNCIIVFYLFSEVRSVLLKISDYFVKQVPE